MGPVFSVLLYRVVISRVWLRISVCVFCLLCFAAVSSPSIVPTPPLRGTKTPPTTGIQPGSHDQSRDAAMWPVEVDQTYQESFVCYLYSYYFVLFFIYRLFSIWFYFSCVSSAFEQMCSYVVVHKVGSTTLQLLFSVAVFTNTINKAMTWICRSSLSYLVSKLTDFQKYTQV